MHSSHSLATELGNALTQRGWLLATAESCTGGGIAAAVTDVAGSSGWFERGFVAYSNEAKQDMLGVDADRLEKHGAVSAEVAEAMAAGALQCSRADIAVAVTGIAGPDGGSAGKPVGTVWFGWASRQGGNEIITSSCRHFAGDREAVRKETVRHALQELLRLAERPGEGR